MIRRAGDICWCAPFVSGVSDTQCCRLTSVTEYADTWAVQLSTRRLDNKVLALQCCQTCNTSATSHTAASAASVLCRKTLPHSRKSGLFRRDGCSEGILKTYVHGRCVSLQARLGAPASNYQAQVRSLHAIMRMPTFQLALYRNHEIARFNPI